MSEYKYLIFDGQYFLTRNFKKLLDYKKNGDPYLYPDGTTAIDNDKNVIYYQHPNFDYLYLARSFFQSIAKFVREKHSCEKVILVWDKYPYAKHSFLPKYKGDRHYATDDDLIGLNPESDINKIINVKFEVEALEIKQKAKYWIIENFENLGMKSYIRTGYEADDFAGVISKYLYDKDPSVKSGIVSIDSDWSYLTQPNIDHLKPRGDVITYDQVTEWNKEIYDKFEISHYELKSIIDSIFGSHNFLECTLSNNFSSLSLLELCDMVIREDYSFATNKELFEAQLKSFSVKDYSGYDSVIKSLWYLDKGGKIKDEISYKIFKDNTNFGVSVNYYSDFTSRLNHELYEEDNVI